MEVTLPVKSPATFPVTSPVRFPVTSPVTSPVKSPVTFPVTFPVKLPIKVEATKDSEPTVHLLFVSSHTRVTLESSPLSISIPASTVAEPVALEFRTITLSSTVKVSVSNIVWVPWTVKLPVIVKSLPIVTSSGKPIVKVWPLALVSISLVVPWIVKVCESKSTAPVPVSPAKSTSCAVTSDNKATVPEASWKVIVLSAVGSVTTNVDSKESSVAPSRVIDGPLTVKLDVSTVLNWTESEVPNPKESLTVEPDSATHCVPLPTIKFESVGLKEEISSKFIS